MTCNATFTPTPISVVYLQPDKQVTTTASLLLLAACSFLQLTCSPQFYSSVVCLMCRSVSIFRIERKLSSFIILHLPLSGFLPDFTSLFNVIPCLFLFYVRLIDFLLPSSYLSMFLFLALEPVIQAYSDHARSSGHMVLLYQSVVETFMYSTCRLQIEIWDMGRIPICICHWHCNGLEWWWF